VVRETRLILPIPLSASSLATKYLNQIFLVTREVRDRVSAALEVAADYGELGWLLVTVALIPTWGPTWGSFAPNEANLTECPRVRLSGLE
jgi:hypothetical protein